MSALDMLTNLHSNDAEQSVIGALLIDASAVDNIGALRPEHFWNEIHRTIYGEILAMSIAAQPIDVITVAMSLEAKGCDCGGLAYLGELANAVPSSRNVHRYAQAIVDKAMERRLLEASNEIRGIVSSTGTTKEKLAKAQSEVMAITESVASKQPRKLSEVLTSAIEVMTQRHEGESNALSTGFDPIDRKLSGGLKPGNLVIVAGRPGMGKTAFSSNIGHFAAEAGKHVLFLSMEMTDQELVDRLVASSGRVSLTSVIEGDMAGQSGERIMAGFAKLADIPLWIDDQSSLSLFDVTSKARTIKRKHGLDLLVIDYLQLMSGEGNNRNQEIEAISRGLKGLAKELEIPVICLSQLSRKCEERTNKRPMPSDLRESGAIEQDADVIIMVYRDEVYSPDSPDKGVAEIIIGKNRQGSTGIVPLAYIGEYTKFEPLASDWQRHEPVKKPTRGFHV